MQILTNEHASSHASEGHRIAGESVVLSECRFDNGGAVALVRDTDDRYRYTYNVIDLTTRERILGPHIYDGDPYFEIRKDFTGQNRLELRHPHQDSGYIIQYAWVAYSDVAKGPSIKYGDNGGDGYDAEGKDWIIISGVPDGVRPNPANGIQRFSKPVPIGHWIHGKQQYSHSLTDEQKLIVEYIEDRLGIELDTEHRPNVEAGGYYCRQSYIQAYNGRIAITTTWGYDV